MNIRKKSFSNIIYIIFIVTLTVGIMLSSTGCNSRKPVSDTENSDVYEKDVFAMDTYMNLKAYGENAEKAVKQASDYIYNLSLLLDVTEPGSEIYKLNARSISSVSDTTFDILSESVKYSRLTAGNFDPTVYPIVKAWGFTTDSDRIPTQEEIDSLLPHVGMDKISLNASNNGVLFSDPETALDTGAIAKGYVSQKIYDIFKENGVDSAIVSLGGNVLAMGAKNQDAPWKVGISNPANPDTNIGTVSVINKFLVTSGSYQRFFVKGGKTYHHIIDPSTGKPADNGLTSVTIIAEDGTAADALSTALFVMGRKDASVFWRNSKIDFEAVLIENNGDIYITEGLKSDFQTEAYNPKIISKQ